MRRVAVALAAITVSAFAMAGPSDERIQQIVDVSQDSDKYAKEFSRAAREIASKPKCLTYPMVQNGGFMKRSNVGRDQYFIYCSSDMTRATRYYYDPIQDRIWRE